MTPSWAYLGPSWVQLAAILSQLKAIRNQRTNCSMISGTFLTPSWAYLGPSWVQLAAILSQLKAIEGHLGAMFHSSSAILQLLAAKMRPESEKTSTTTTTTSAKLASSWRQVGPSWRSIGLKILMLKPSCGEVKTKCVLCILLGPSWGLSCGSSWPQMASRRSQDGLKIALGSE